MKKVIALITSATTVAILLIVTYTAAGAQSLDLTIPNETHQGAPGSEVVFATLDTGSLEGGTCVVTLVTSNNESIHPDNYIAIDSANRLQFDDVEATPNFEETHSDELVVGSTISISLGFGASGVSSAGFSAHLDCTPTSPPTTTVDEPPPTTTVLPPALPPVPVPGEPTFTG